MDRCPPTRPLELVTTPSTPFSLKLEPASMYPELSLSIWNPLLLMKSALEPTANCFTQNNLSLERKMLPTTTLVDTTPLERKLLTWFWTGFVSLLINVLACKVFRFSTPLVAAPDLVSPPC